MTSAHAMLIGWSVAAVALLVILVTRFKLNAFLALLLAALLVGFGSGKPMLMVAKAFQDGMGATLGGIAAVIGLGVMLGKLLGISGGAEVVAKRFIEFFGPSRVVWCITALGIVVGLTTWFVVGLMLLLPILLTLTRESKRPLLELALPLLAALSVMHGLMPPHPGPVLAIEELKANTGMVIFWGFVIGLPVVGISGPLLARWLLPRVAVALPESVQRQAILAPRPPAFGLTLFTMLLPVFLMLLTTISDLALAKGAVAKNVISFFGNPTIALLISVLLALWSLGTRCGLNRGQLLTATEECVASVGMTLLIVGGGGGFARVLREVGVAEALGAVASAAHLPPLVYGWLVAVFIRVATGSATVAITAASALLAPIVAATPGTNVELLVISIGCGSLFLSHLNDGGFWIVKDSLGMTVSQTLRTWTICETVIGLAGLGLALLINALL